jgi:TetR/AcrR family acrAB operon transcriptional repressor
MVRKTKAEALATRNAILDAAEIVFQERGVSKTSLAEIAAAAGVTRGAVYWHFTNKVDLFNAMIQRIHGLMEAKLEELQATRQYGDPVELLRELALHFLDRVANDPRYYRIIEIAWHKCEYVGEMAKIYDQHFERSSRFLDVGIKAFEAAREAGFIAPQADSRTAAIGMMAIIDGLVVNWTLDDSAFPLIDTGARVIDSYLAGLRPPPCTRSGSDKPFHVTRMIKPFQRKPEIAKRNTGEISGSPENKARRILSLRLTRCCAPAGTPNLQPFPDPFYLSSSPAKAASISSSSRFVKPSAASSGSMSSRSSRSMSMSSSGSDSNTPRGSFVCRAAARSAARSNFQRTQAARARMFAGSVTGVSWILRMPESSRCFATAPTINLCSLTRPNVIKREFVKQIRRAVVGELVKIAR